jgi:AraC-like DNA-binding protein
MPFPRRPAESSPAAPRYTELPPGPALEPWVACYWSIRAADAAAVTHRVLPDGCADLIVGVPDHPEPVIVGTMLRALVVPLGGPVDMFGVRFRPGGALPFVGTRLDELTDRRVALHELWGPGAEAFGESLAPALMETRAALAERMLAHRLHSRPRRREADEVLTARAVAFYRRARGGVGVREVSAALGIGERRLERLFERYVGVGPRTLGRVLRFRRALREIERARVARTPPSWPAIAFAAGYADQPHLIREFKALAGLTPARYAAERRIVGLVQDQRDEGA